jgi:hypothetical protein
MIERDRLDSRVVGSSRTGEGTPVEIKHSEEDSELHLIIHSTDVPMARLLKIQETFMAFLHELGKSMADTTRDPVEWVVRSVHASSLDFALDTEALSDRTPPDLPPAIKRAASLGLRVLHSGAERPEFYTDRVLEAACEFASLADEEMPIRVGNAAGALSITPIIKTHIEEILVAPITAIGTVEGKLESVTVHDRRVFNIFDPLTRERIECHFAHRIKVEDIARAIERRVLVTGEIRYRDSGEIASVKAEDLAVIPLDADLPTADDVRGILSN